MALKQVADLPPALFSGENPRSGSIEGWGLGPKDAISLFPSRNVDQMAEMEIWADCPRYHRPSGDLLLPSTLTLSFVCGGDEKYVVRSMSPVKVFVKGKSHHFKSQGASGFG